MLRLFNNKNNQFSYLFILIDVYVFIHSMYLGPIIQSDSGTYIKGYPHRSALYPLIFKLYTLVLGENFYFLVALQLILGFVAIHYAVRLFTQIFALNVFLKLLVYLLFLSPYIESLLIGNSIMTEAICYPLFIFALGELIKGTINQNYKNLLMGLVWTSLLVLTRKQFIFLYPLIGIILTFIFIKYKQFAGKYLVLITFISSIIVTNILERTYHYVYHGHFSDVPFTGFTLINSPLYLSLKKDANIFDNPLERELFIRVRNEMEERGFTIYHVDGVHYSYYKKFAEIRDKICYKIISPKCTELKIYGHFIIDPILTNIAIKLIKAHPLSYCKLVQQNIIENMSWERLFKIFYNKVTSWTEPYYIFIIMFIIYFWKLCGFHLHPAFVSFLYRGKVNDYNVVITSLIILLAHFGNYLLVALVEMVLDRYSIYTDVFAASLLISLLSVAMSKKSTL